MEDIRELNLICLSEKKEQNQENEEDRNQDNQTSAAIHNLKEFNNYKKHYQKEKIPNRLISSLKNLKSLLQNKEVEIKKSYKQKKYNQKKRKCRYQIRMLTMRNL